MDEKPNASKTNELLLSDEPDIDDLDGIEESDEIPATNIIVTELSDKV